MVDDKRSANLLAQVSFDGVDDEWFFANSFTNHPPKSTNECMIATVERKFSESSKFPFSIGTGHFAKIQQDGDLVPNEEVHFPYELIYEPNTSLFVKSADGQDFLDYFDEMSMLHLRDVSETSPVTLFTVKARENPGDDPKKIGTIDLTSELFRSKFGDEKLFFRHETFNRDLKYLRENPDESDERLKMWADEALRRETGNLWHDDVVKPFDTDSSAMDQIEQGII